MKIPSPTITMSDFEDAVRYLESHNHPGPIMWPITPGTRRLMEDAGLTVGKLAGHGIQLVMIDWVGNEYLG